MDTLTQQEILNGNTVNFVGKSSFDFSFGDFVAVLIVSFCMMYTGINIVKFLDKKFSERG